MSEVRGILGVIGCPIMEDEIVYAVKRDEDISKVYVIDNEDSRNLVRKLRSASMEPTVVSEEEAAAISSDGFSVLILMESVALHENPSELRVKVASSVKRYMSKCRSILLFYGLCGNAFKDMSQVRDGASPPLFILTDTEGRTVDDCIAAVLGGTDGYLRLLRRYPGVFYLTPAWAENWKDMIYKMEVTRGSSRDDLSTLKWLFDLAGYRKALKLDTGLGDQEVFDRKVDEFVKEFNFEKGELEKEFICLDVIDSSYDRAKGEMAPDKRNGEDLRA